MTPLQTAGIIIVAAVLVFGVIKIFSTPIKFILRLLLNTIVGFIALIIINFFGKFLGVSIGVNWINAVIIGIFGAPGVALLLILQWLMSL